MSKLDYLYRRLLLTKFFVKGWGKPENLKRIFEFRKIISDREKCRHLVRSDYPIHIDKVTIQNECRVLEGHFKSPFVDHLPGIMPKDVETAYFQMILPRKWNTKLKPVCIHLAGTGDHNFWRRRVFSARPLLKFGIASIILENPYYGVRKPKQQLRSSLHNVSDLFVMGGALVLESLALFHWCEREGYGPLGITGISMGGFMASLAATNWHKPLALIPCLSWSTASSVFTRGVMSGAIPWKLLQDQYKSDHQYEDEVTKLIVSPEDMRTDKAFQLGRNFAQHYPESLEALKDFQDKFYNDVHSSTENNVELTANSSSKPQDQLRLHQHGSETVKKSQMFYSMNFQNSTASVAISHLTDALKWQRVSSLLTGKQSIKNNKNMQKEALSFMRGVMDECTHLGNFSCPVDPTLIIIIAAKKDAYVPRDSVLSLEEIWPGAEVRYIDSGHIVSFLLKQEVFRTAIVDAFNRLIKKYYS